MRGRELVVFHSVDDKLRPRKSARAGSAQGQPGAELDPTPGLPLKSRTLSSTR